MKPEKGPDRFPDLRDQRTATAGESKCRKKPPFEAAMKCMVVAKDYPAQQDSFFTSMSNV